MIRTASTALLLLIALGAIAQDSAPKEPALSAAEQAIVNRQIASLKLPQERQIANEWSNAKKIAELICRPAALPVLERADKSVDKVFLGTDSPESLTLATDGRLTGSGQYRNSKGWQDISFTCEVTPETGKVKSFSWTPATAQPSK